MYNNQLKTSLLHIHPLLARILDMDHNLIQQARQRDRIVLGLVTQRIVTTQASTISQSDQQENTFRGQIRHKISQVCGKEGGAKCQSDYYSKQRCSLQFFRPIQSIYQSSIQLSNYYQQLFLLKVSLSNVQSDQTQSSRVARLKPHGHNYST